MYHPLVDWELAEFIDAGRIDDCPHRLINPASVNLEIGNNALVENARTFGHGSTLDRVDLQGYTVERPLMVPPGALILCDVRQTLHLPNSHEAQVILRSSAGRAGWDHALSGYVDPGYHGRLTLELVNCRRWQELPLYPGQQLVQLRIYQLDRKPISDYSQTGRYHRAHEVEPCKDATLCES